MQLTTMDFDHAPEILESLPYYDNDLEKHPQLRSKVDEELARELKQVSQQTLHPRVPPSVSLFDVSKIYGL